jgi:hypothetical protein
MDALVALLELGRGRFTLAFVSYERPSHRDWIIPRLRFRLLSWNLGEVSLVDPVLARAPSAEGLFAAIERAAARSVGGRPIDALLLADWEKAIDFDHPDGAQPASALLGVFNMGRGLFKRRPGGLPDGAGGGPPIHRRGDRARSPGGRPLARRRPR